MKCPHPSREDPGSRCPSSKPCWHSTGRRGHSSVWSSIPLGQTRPDTRPISPARQRPPAGTARKGKGPLGVSTEAPPPFSPRPAPRPIQPETDSRIPTRGSPESRRWVRACVHPTAALRTPEWRPGLEVPAGRWAQPRRRPLPAPRAPGGRRRRRGRREAGGLCDCGPGLGGTRWVWGRRAHLPPVSAAIAGHMTEAVAGMTVRALATRGGGRPREGGRGCRGAD